MEGTIVFVIDTDGVRMCDQRMRTKGREELRPHACNLNMGLNQGSRTLVRCSRCPVGARAGAFFG